MYNQYTSSILHMIIHNSLKSLNIWKFPSIIHYYLYGIIDISLKRQENISPIKRKTQQPNKPSNSQVPLDRHQVNILHIITLHHILQDGPYNEIDSHSHQVQRHHHLEIHTPSANTPRIPLMHIPYDYSNRRREDEKQDEEKNSTNTMNCRQSWPIYRRYRTIET